MNDEELRAFLESAADGGPDENDAADAGAGTPDETAPEQGAGRAAADSAPRSPVPSFDELMGFPPPAAEPDDARSSAQGSPARPSEPARESRPAAAETARPAEPEQPQEAGDWNQAFAEDDDEQLVPLILPGFSPEPRTKRPLPPVFQAEPAEPDRPEPMVDPAPTQPFDVVSEEPAAPEPTPARSAVPAAAAAPVAATVAAASASASGPSGQADSREDPFAALSIPQHDAAPETDEYEKISVTGGAPRGRKALPWIIVGGGAVIAIIASIFVINGVRGTGEPEPTSPPPATSEPTTESPSPDPEPTAEPEPEPEGPPAVDPGSVYPLDITQWGLTVERSNSFGGSTPYTLFDNNTRAMFTLPLAESLSASCAQASKPEVWGLLKKDDGKLEVVRPEPRCTDAGDAAVYDKIWGLMDHMAKSAKPTG